MVFLIVNRQMLQNHILFYFMFNIHQQTYHYVLHGKLLRGLLIKSHINKKKYINIYIYIYIHTDHINLKAGGGHRHIVAGHRCG